jgi:hypothetical protein
MKITKRQLQRIIREEKRRLNEGGLAGHFTGEAPPEQGKRTNSSSALQAINNLEKKLKTLGFTGPRVLHLLDELSNATMFPERKDWGAK